MIEKTAFLVFADLHIDIMHDSIFRLEKIISTAKEKNVHFIISLGDFTYPDNEFLARKNIITRDRKAFFCDRNKEKQQALNMLSNCGIPVYHVLGNHESDVCNKSISIEYLGIEKPYYSFDINGLHFVVLDCNFIFDGQQYIDYENCNYHYYEAHQLPFLPPEQMKWLEKDIINASGPSIIFSHQSLSDKVNGIQNRKDVWKLFNKINKDKKRVVLSMNGHSHIDGMSEHGNIPFININSTSNIWLGSNYQTIRYSEEINEKYPYIKLTAPYKDPLFAVVTIDDNNIRIDGAKSEFVGPSPYELGFPRSCSEYISTPFITDYLLPLMY
jgi:predicted phosphodiesterase